MKRLQARGTKFTSLLNDHNIQKRKLARDDDFKIEASPVPLLMFDDGHIEAANTQAGGYFEDLGADDAEPKPLNLLRDSAGSPDDVCSVKSDDSNISAEYYSRQSGDPQKRSANVKRHNPGPPRCFEPPRVIVDRRKRHVKHTKSFKQVSNVLLLHIDGICKQKGCRLLDLFHGDMDTDMGNSVDYDELLAFFQRIGLSMDEERRQRIFAEWDTNNNGSIDLLELDQAMRVARRLRATGTAFGDLEDYHIKAFRSYDAVDTSAVAAATFTRTMATPLVTLTTHQAQRPLSRPSTAGRSRYTPQFARTTDGPGDHVHYCSRPQSAASVRSGALPPSFNGIAKAKLRLKQKNRA